MKKLLLMALMLLLASCATTSAKKYSYLTMGEVEDKCKPDQSWNMSILGLRSYVVLSQGCLSFERLLIIRMDNESYTEEIRNSTIEVLKAHFIHFVDSRGYFEDVELGPGKVKWYLKRLKTEIDKGVITHFFDLTYKKADPQKGQK